MTIYFSTSNTILSKGQIVQNLQHINASESNGTIGYKTNQSNFALYYTSVTREQVNIPEYYRARYIFRECFNYPVIVESQKFLHMPEQLQQGKIPLYNYN